MLSRLSVACACWALLTSAQWEREAPLQPATYRSPSGQYELFVDPTSRHGEGAGRYRMSYQGEELWSTEHAFTFQEAVVADDGSSAGYAYAGGRSGHGRFVVAILEPTGEVRALDLTDRSSSRYLHFDPDPRARGVLHQPDADRFVVRVIDPDVNASNETWWNYRMSTGEALGRIYPKTRMEDPENARWSVAAAAVPATQLVLSSWWGYDDIHRSGGRFCLTTPQGGVVWQKDLPGDYELEDDEAEDRLRDEIQAGDAILGVGPGPRFELRFAKSAERVTFDVVEGPNGRFVRETGRKPYEPGPPASEPAVPVQDIELKKLGHVRFGTGPVNDSPVRSVIAYDVDDLGRIGVVRMAPNGQANFSFALLDPEGSSLRSIELEEIPGDPRPDVGLLWIEDDRWLITRSLHGPQVPAEAFWLDAKTGALERIDAWKSPSIEQLARGPDGRIFALATYRWKYTMKDALIAFDERGRVLWEVGEDYQDPAKLFSPMDVAVTADRQVVVLGLTRRELHVFSVDGEYQRTVDLRATLGKKPEYPTDLHAPVDGGLLIEDQNRFAVLDESFELVRWFQPHYADGSVTGIRTLAIDPAGNWWSRDVSAFLELDEEGQVQRFVGPEPDPDALTGIARVAVDHLARVHMVDSRSGAVHVFDRNGSALHVGQPKKGDWGERVTVSWLSVRGDGTLFVGGGYGDFILEFSPDGERKRRLTGEVCGPDWTFVPGRSERWTRVLEEIELVGGAEPRRLERDADGSWLIDPSTLSVAADGSVIVVDKGHPAVHFYGSSGKALRLTRLPEGPYYYHAAYNGSLAVIRGAEGEFFLIPASGAALRRFSPGLDGTVHFSPDGQEIWLFPSGKAEMIRFALP